MITAVVLTHNSEATIKACLSSLHWCDHLIIVDDFSTDKTLALAKPFNPKIYFHPLNQDFSQQRNFGLSKAITSWVLFVDSDEIVPKALAESIKAVISQTAALPFNYQLKRTDFFLNQKLKFGETNSVRLTRLTRRNSGQWVGKVHETFLSNFTVKTINSPLIHRRYFNINQWLFRLDYYSSLRAEDLFSIGKKFHLISVLLNPLAKFIQNYLLRLGFLDGFPGLAMAFSMSLHSLFVRIKHYELQFKSSVTG